MWDFILYLQYYLWNLTVIFLPCSPSTQKLKNNFVRTPPITILYQKQNPKYALKDETLKNPRTPQGETFIFDYIEKD